MIRIGLTLAVIAALIALAPFVSEAISGSDPGAIATIADPTGRPAEAAALDGCIGQKGPREAGRCIGRVAQMCLDRLPPRSAEAIAECHRREAEAWSSLIVEYRGKLERRLLTDRRKLAHFREAERAWLSERTRRCGGPAPAPVCDMTEAGRRALYL